MQLLGVRRDGDRLVPDSTRHLRSVRGKVGMVFQQFNLFPTCRRWRMSWKPPGAGAGTSKREARNPRPSSCSPGWVGRQGERITRRKLSGVSSNGSRSRGRLRCNPASCCWTKSTSALDPELVGEVLEVVQQLMVDEPHDDGHRDPRDGFRARRSADRVIFMDDGHIAEDTTPDLMFSNPSNERTRSFLRAVLDR